MPKALILPLHPHLRWTTSSTAAGCLLFLENNGQTLVREEGALCPMSAASQMEVEER